MSLSICLLTRNEEANLPRVLGSVAGLADQIVVADTGSTDRTIAVAAERGANVCRFDWNDDFSAGRNFALSQACGDWVLWLNPDEEMLSASHARVRQAIGRQEALAFGATVQALVKQDQADHYSETAQIRLFRRHPEIRFAGRVHPTFAVPLEKLAVETGMFIYASDITIRHHAYLSTLSPAKLQWAARLFALELKDHPDRFRTLIHYGKTLLLLGDTKGHEVLARAEEQLLERQSDVEPPFPDVPVLLEYLLTIAPAKSRSKLSQDQAWELAQRWFPTHAALYWIRAAQLFRQGDYREASRLLKVLIHLGKTQSYDRSLTFDPAILGGFALMNLGACYIHLRLLDQAEACFQQLADTPQYGTQARQNLAMISALKNKTRGTLDPRDLYFMNPPD
jgi:hypothetical protein